MCIQLILAFICLSAKAVLAKIRSPVVLATLKLMVFHLGKVADASTQQDGQGQPWPHVWTGAEYFQCDLSLES